MISRQRRISASITRAVLAGDDSNRPSRSLVARALAFFSLLSVTLQRIQGDMFARLRRDVWRIDEEEYKDSFAEALGHGNCNNDSSSNNDSSTSNVAAGLKAVGDLGYSGSVFFATPDGKFLVKSLNRGFEYDHFETAMARPYAAHMAADAAGSLLVRIVDYLGAPGPSLGTLAGLTPPRYMVMENLLGGRDGEPVRSGEWETYDLKPDDYFFPERDIADGALAPDSVKDRLVDRFDDKLRITRAQYEEFRRVLEADTALLEATNCVDYSLFLVRFPADLTKCEPVRSNRDEWREGLRSTDGKWRYRVVLLDFFFAKHKFEPQMMTGLIKAFNFFSRKGPMSITTTPREYRTRFLKMIDELVEAS